MSDEIRLLIESLSREFSEDNPAEVAHRLINETVKFRDKLKEETGQVLTVADTRAALDALEAHIEGKKLPSELTSEQKSLAQIFIDRITLFKT